MKWKYFDTSCSATGQVGLNWIKLSDPETDNRPLVSSENFQFIQTPTVESYASLGLSGSADMQLALGNPVHLWPPEDSCLVGGVVSQENIDHMKIEQSIDFPVIDTADTRESSAFQLDRSPWADSVVMTEATTVSTTPQAAVGGTECKGENHDTNEASCDTCFGVVGAR
jgi:hypothetical protein